MTEVAWVIQREDGAYLGREVPIIFVEELIKSETFRFKGDADKFIEDHLNNCKSVKIEIRTVEGNR